MIHKLRRLALVAILALITVLGFTPTAQASASAWYNDCSSQTYVTVQVYNAGWHYVNINPCYRAGSSYVQAVYYKLTAGWCSRDDKSTDLNYTTVKHVGNNTNPWVYIPYNETTLVYRC